MSFKTVRFAYPTELGAIPVQQGGKEKATQAGSNELVWSASSLSETATFTVSSASTPSLIRHGLGEDMYHIRSAGSYRSRHETRRRRICAVQFHGDALGLFCPRPGKGQFFAPVR